MKALVIYASRTGNTRTLAEAIAETMRERGTAVEVFDAEQAPMTLPECDLIFVGGPTERHTLTPAVVGFFDRLEAGSLRGKAGVAFDTRMQWPRFVSGSAADEIAKRLKAAGARLVTVAESFFVRTEPVLGYELVPGELARARTWTTQVAREVGAEMAVA
ncbi:MAG TPA: flavodoxin domain-containing protein [Candidatus Saccharimonadales bacterium]|jgi:flavodoxin|nr:flavodoxin domain-containing protein [Candidatus Saccharimonadales bacterium]